MTDIKVGEYWAKAKGFKIEATHNIKRTEWLPVPNATRVDVTASITVTNPETYRALLGTAPTFTIETTADLNPNHRWARTLRQFCRQLRDIFVWEWRTAIYGQQAEALILTLPNVKAGNLTIEGPAA